VALLGLIVSASGLVLDFPNFDQTRNTMQVANIVHGVGALLFVLASFGHIYMGTIGTEGAYQAMKTGMVDETWAKEHHQLWYEEVKAGKRSGGEARRAELLGGS
jgi:formate dehydrogenase subunit gamma